MTKREKDIEYEAKAVELAGRRYIVCRNREEMKKDAAARAAILAALERQLKKDDKRLIGNMSMARENSPLMANENSPVWRDGDQPNERSAPPFFDGRPRRFSVGGMGAGCSEAFERMCSGRRSACWRRR